MKKLVSIVSLVVASQSFAAINCKPFKEEVNHAQAVVDSFAGEVLKLQDQLSRVEGHISNKYAQIDPIIADISSSNSLIESLKIQRANIKADIDQLKVQLDQDLITESSLIADIQDLEVQIDMTSPRNPARRQLMREKNRKKKMLERVQISISSQTANIEPLKQSLKSVRQDIQFNKSKVVELEQEKIIVENQAPKLSALLNKKSNLIQDIQQSDVIAQANIANLDLALEKQLMCKTYTVKYDLSLDIAKEIYNVGCDNYQLQGFNGKFKKQAEIETLESICGQ